MNSENSFITLNEFLMLNTKFRVASLHTTLNIVIKKFIFKMEAWNVKLLSSNLTHCLYRVLHIISAFKDANNSLNNSLSCFNYSLTSQITCHSSF